MISEISGFMCDGSRIDVRVIGMDAMKYVSGRLLLIAILFFVLDSASRGKAADYSALVRPVVGSELVFEERGGVLAVEAEHFFAQDAADTRAWYRQSVIEEPMFGLDADRSHASTASGQVYLECLPDSRHNHSHKLIQNENFTNTPGEMAVLSYKTFFNQTGRYYVWVRAYSTGSEDNGLHVGLDGRWPESGRRMQWCQGKNGWRWESRQRTEAVHCGEPYKIFLDIDKPGEHTIHFSMREDGFEFDKFFLTTEREFARPNDAGPKPIIHAGTLPDSRHSRGVKSGARALPDLVLPRLTDGDGSVEITGELKQWHKVTVTLNGYYAHELDNHPNPFRDYRMSVRFAHDSGGAIYEVPGYFAADGKAATSSADAGTKWRAHFTPDRTGDWTATVRFMTGKDVALDARVKAEESNRFSRGTVKFSIVDSDKSGRDFRSKGRLQYVGERYLNFAGNGEYFIKAGADAPETFLGYADFDGTVARKRNVPLKTWSPHLGDWKEGDPTWKNGKGKGMIGALNYLASKGCNVFSFLTYNAGGDGDNVWPFVAREDKFHYDCSKLDQWGIVFDHGTRLGHYLHFKMQETENDDHNRGGAKPKRIPECLDDGDLGPERRLYCRELVARFGHALALNWNLGEENTQTTGQQKAMAQYIQDIDPYDNLIVVHTFPDQQEKVYRPLLGGESALTGMSLQNSHIRDTHSQVVSWVDASVGAGKPWVVAFDESGSAAHGQVPDLGYEGFAGIDSAGEKIYTQHDVRKQTLWGALMGGSAGLEYYFGYRVPQNDLICEDWRSRDQSWDYCRYALQFFSEIPFSEMKNADALVGNKKNDNSIYCFAKKGDIYVVYLPEGGNVPLDLSHTEGDFKIEWYNPRTGGERLKGTKASVSGGRKVSFGLPPTERRDDWVAIIHR